MTTEAVDTGLSAPPATTSSEVSEFSRARRAWITVVLGLVAFLAATDRNILSVLLVPIQQDLGVGDAAMGALTGTAFALVYAGAALPLAWVADRTNRRNFIALAVAFWSAMTALCGLAGNYVQLLFARFGVAAGEAAHGPAGMSMVADVFPEAKRGAAISVITVGAALGFSAGAYIAGVASDHFGWQGAMLVVGLPGLLVAALVWLTLPEPRRGAQDGGSAPHAPPSILSGVRQLARVRTFIPLMIGMIFLNIAFMGWLHWLPAFFMRVHHMSTSNMSAVFGIVVGVGGVLSNVFAGVASDRLARRGSRWRMYYCVGMGVVALPLMVVGLLLESATLTVACMIGYSLAAGGLTTVTSAATISIAPASLRASVVALIGFAVSVFGGGLGPFLIGLLNDGFHTAYGETAVRYTLLLTGPLGLMAATGMFLIASRTMDADCAAVASGATKAPAPPPAPAH